MSQDVHLSVRPSVRLPHAGTVLKRLNIGHYQIQSSNFFHLRVAISYSLHIACYRCAQACRYWVYSVVKKMVFSPRRGDTLLRQTWKNRGRNVGTQLRGGLPVKKSLSSTSGARVCWFNIRSVIASTRYCFHSSMFVCLFVCLHFEVSHVAQGPTGKVNEEAQILTPPCKIYTP